MWAELSAEDVELVRSKSINASGGSLDAGDVLMIGYRTSVMLHHQERNLKNPLYEFKMFLTSTPWLEDSVPLSPLYTRPPLER